nr:immunoglobulin light chain junction region [Macaca mulatta]
DYFCQVWDESSEWVF